MSALMWQGIHYLSGVLMAAATCGACIWIIVQARHILGGRRKVNDGD